MHKRGELIINFWFLLFDSQIWRYGHSSLKRDQVPQRSTAIPAAQKLEKKNVRKDRGVADE